MSTIKSQKGVGGVGWIAILALIAFFTLVALKIVPVYMNSITVGSILSDMEKEPNLRGKSPAEILETLGKRLSINMIRDIGRDEIFLESDKDMYYVEIDYEVRREFIGNIDLVLRFKKYAEIPKQ